MFIEETKDSRAKQAVNMTIAGHVRMMMHALPAVTAFCKQGVERDGDQELLAVGLANPFATEIVLDSLVEQATKYSAQLRGQWIQDIQSIVKCLDQWVPPGWESKVPSLLGDVEVSGECQRVSQAASL